MITVNIRLTAPPAFTKYLCLTRDFPDVPLPMVMDGFSVSRRSSPPVGGAAAGGSGSAAASVPTTATGE